MVHAARPVILAFINDFNLKNPDGVVAFNATVMYTINGVEKSFETEVQIITSGNQEAIYFLNPAIPGAGLPDMLNAESENITYTPGESLNIKHRGNNDQFEVGIFPKQP